ncbi:hypothetical protein LEMLEM_LOCUS24367 [Lemmus lemmus]
MEARSPFQTEVKLGNKSTVCFRRSRKVICLQSYPHEVMAA